MPWEIKKRHGEFCVFKEGEDSPIDNGCYKEEGDAKDRMAALYASEGKSLKGKQDRSDGQNNNLSDLSERAEDMDDPATTKVHSLTHTVDMVHRAFGSEFDRGHDYYYYVAEIFDDHVIGCFDDGFYMIPYSIDGDEVEFASRAEWTEVEEKREWLEQGKSVPPTMGMDSYSKTIRRVSDAWYDHSNWAGYVHDVTPERAIVNLKGVHWSIPYSEDESGVTFADEFEWEKTPGKKEWEDARSYTIKAINDSRIGAYAVLWGDESRKDLHGEWFDSQTEELKTIFKAMGGIPFLFHHGIDDTVKSTVIGAVDVMEEDERGLWFEAKILEFEAYRDYVEPLIEKEALFPSSGTLPGAKRVSKSGRIKRWPIAEITGTHIPAEFRMLQKPISEIKSAYKSAGINVADFEEQFANDDETENRFETKGVEEARFRIETELRQSKLQLLDLELI